MKQRRWTEKQHAKWERELAAAAGESLLKLGAERRERDYEYVIDTRGGPLVVHPFYCGVACRFLNVERAKRELPWLGWEYGGGANPYSGKWNLHVFEGVNHAPVAEYVRQLEVRLAHVRAKEAA